MSAWDEGRPIYRRLPEDSGQYQGNPIVDAITYPIDQILTQYKVTLENFETDFINPDTAKESNLDWLGQLSGFTGQYWDIGWTAAQKRKLIKNSHNFVWAKTGTKHLLLWLLNEVFELGATIYEINQFLLNSSLLDVQPLGGELLRYYILLPLKYSTNSQQWRLAEKLNLLFSPIYVESDVVYDQFYLNVSGLGDPILS
jgi:hypothetical protein